MEPVPENTESTTAESFKSCSSYKREGTHLRKGWLVMVMLVLENAMLIPIPM